MATYIGKGKLNFIEELADTVYITVDETGVFYYEAPFGLSISDIRDFDKVYNVFFIDEDEGYDLIEDHGEIIYDSNSEDAHYLLSKNFFRLISEEQHPFEVEDAYNSCMINNNNVKDDNRVKDVVGYEGLYEVSRDGDVFSLGRVVYDPIGRVRHIKPKKLNANTHGGYPEVRLTDENGKSRTHCVHRLVAEAFIPNPDNKEFVNHIDGIKTNNCVTNLEWATCGENNTHAYETGLRNDNYEVVQLTEDGEYVAIHKSLKNAADSVFNGLKRNEIWKMCTGQRTIPIDDYVFMYAKDYDFDSTILFAKVRPSARIPSRDYPNAGFDVYACFDEDYFVIEPHETKLVPTGIASAFENDYVAILKERGSTGSKGMGERAGVVDANYRGEWFACITNHNEAPLIISKQNVQLPLQYKNAIIYPYTKAICQALFIKVPDKQVKEVSLEDLQSFKSERGTGCLGSSGK